MPTAVPAIDPAPTVPVRGDRVNFATQTQAWIAWEKVAYPQSVLVAQSAYANAVEVLANATAAAASAAAAQALAGAVLFNPLTNYGQGDAAISAVNFLTYRRKTAGISATDPSADAANWVNVGLPPVVLVRAVANFTAVPGVTYILTVNDIQLTMPAAPGAQDVVTYRLGVGVTRAVLKGNGNKLEGQLADIAVDIPGFSGSCLYNTTDGWMHF